MDINLELNVVQDVVQDSDIVASIITAIETHNTIAFTYNKDVAFSGIRKVNPHCLYWKDNNKQILLDGVQIQGDSKSGIKSFKQFDLEFVKDVIILDEQFTIHRSYNPTSDRYKNEIIGIVD
jgi:hypothetical protein